MGNQHNIPKIPHRFFKWYCKKDRYEELHGDLEEFYYERVATMGVVKARLLYLRDVLRCCQPYAWRKPKGYSNSNIIMFRNYFKTSLRSMVRNPLSSFINVFGLSVAIGMCIVVYTMLAYSYSLDKFHVNKDKVYLATFFADREGIEAQYGMTPTPLGEMLAQDFDQVAKMSRVKDRNVVIKYEGNVFHENIRYADPAFLEMLTFPLKWGTKSTLSDLNSIILSEDMSIKYFGYENPVGKEVLVKFNGQYKKLFKVSGVAEAFPGAHAISFDFLINFENWKTSDPAFKFNDWSGFVDATLIQINQPEELETIKNGVDKYLSLQHETNSDWDISGFGFEQLATLHENSANIIGDISRDQTDEVLIGLPIMGGFMLALACFNYINMAIGSAAKRLKEIGVRKVIGANRGKVIFQFLMENILLTFFAMLLGLFLTITLFLPWFVNIAGAPLDISLIDGNLWTFLTLIMLFTGIASGIYPSLYVSRFKVVQIFKGAVRFGKKNPLMKAFLGLQMILAFVFITMAVMFHQNSDFQARRPWGYNQHGALYVDVPDLSAFEQMNAAMTQNPNVISISGSGDHIGKSISTTTVHMAERQYEVYDLSVDTNYFQTMGIELKEGTIFKGQLNESRKVVVNELFVKSAVLEKPIGHLFKIDSTQYQIVGVVKDFHAFNFYNRMKPMIFQIAEREDYRFLSMRVREGSEASVYEDLRENWSELFPELPFQGGHQVDLWAKFYFDLGQMKRFTRTIAMIAILLGGLGLYGLVTLNVSGRIKEFSIRKVLGAGLKNISFSITRQYRLLTLVALLIGAPLSYILNLGLVKMMFAYPIPHGYWGVGLAFVILIFVMLGVMSTQIRKVLKSNPVNGLRTE